MARGFTRGRRGVRARLDAHERDLLAHLFGEVHALLDDEGSAETDPLAVMVGIGTAVDLPDDPALARLLPDAFREDEAASGDFRRYTELGLRERKRANLAVARTSLRRDGGLVLTDDEARSWAVALTDVRLVLAERMGVRTEEDHDRLVAQVELDEREPTPDPTTEALGVLLGLYDVLTWLQETLVEALMGTVADPPDPG